MRKRIGMIVLGVGALLAWGLILWIASASADGQSSTPKHPALDTPTSTPTASATPTATPEQLHNPILVQADPPDGVCGGGSMIMQFGYPARRPGLATFFDAVFTASTGSTGGSVIFEAGEGPSTGVYIPPLSASQTYTLTLNFPQGLNYADLDVYTSGDACGSMVTHPIKLSDLSIRIRE